MIERLFLVSCVWAIVAYAKSQEWNERLTGKGDKIEFIDFKLERG